MSLGTIAPTGTLRGGEINAASLDFGTSPTGLGSAPARPQHTRPTKPNAGRVRRRRRVVFGAVAAVVLGAAAFTAFHTPGFALPEPLPTPTVQVLAPVPTPTLDPRAREGEQTELVAALPDAVLALVQRGIAGNNQWQDDHHALEAWTVTYTDGTGPAAQTVTLELGQWREARGATSFFNAQTDGSGEVLRSGEVLVDGEAVGWYRLIDATADTPASLWWRNSTVVFRATGPIDLLPDFYAAFPL